MSDIADPVPHTPAADNADVMEDDAAVLRLHPLSLLLSFLKLIPQFIYIIPALFFGMSKGGALVFVLPAIGALILVSVAISYLKWRRFSYQVGEEEIRISSGILSRNKRSIPYERIQDVNVEQKLLARVFNLAAVKFETGSAGSDDGVLNAVSLDEASRLRDIIRQRKAGIASNTMADADSPATPDAASAEEEEEDTPIFIMDDKRVFIAGLFNFSLIIFAVLAAAAQNFDFLIPDEIFDRDYWIERVDAGKQITGLGLWSQILGLISAVIGLVILGLSTGVITTFLREYGFRLDRTKNGFRRRRGLTTLTDVVMPLHRIQAATVLTGPVRRRFGWHHLKFQSLASDGGKESDHSVAPLATTDEMDRIMAEPEIVREAAAEYLPVRQAYWIQPVIIYSALIAAIGGALAWFLDARLLWLLALILPIIFFMRLHWKHHKYVLTGGQLFVRSGFWRQKLTILPIRKVQSVDIYQSFIDRALGNVSVVLGVAGGSGIIPLTVHDIYEEDGYTLRHALLKAVV